MKIDPQRLFTATFRLRALYRLSMIPEPEEHEPSLYDSLSSAAPAGRPGPETIITATKETLDNDREDVSDAIFLLSD